MINQMTKDRREAYVEVLEVLKNMDKTDVAKIPRDLREFFERNASKDYKFYIDTSKPLEEHKFKDNTINILAMLNLNYWCDDENHKNELLKKYHENDLKYQEELRKKYNTDNLFKKEKQVIYSAVEEENLINMPIQSKEEIWYKKIYNYILKFIKRFI